MGTSQEPAPPPRAHPAGASQVSNWEAPSQPFSHIPGDSEVRKQMTACLFEVQAGKIIQEFVIAHPC